MWPLPLQGDRGPPGLVGPPVSSRHRVDLEGLLRLIILMLFQ